MPEMHLNNLDLLIALVDHLLKTRKEFKNLKKQEIQAIFAKTNLIRHAFNLAYMDSKDLARRTASDKVLIDKAFNIAKNPKYDGYHGGLASMIYKCLNKKSTLLPDKSVSGSGVNIPLEYNEQSAEELHKPIIRK